MKKETVLVDYARVNYLTFWRIARGIRTQRELARLIGVAHSVACSWETGRAIPDVDTAVKLGELLKRPAAAIITYLKEFEGKRNGVPNQ